MKKAFFFIAAAAVLTVASCENKTTAYPELCDKPETGIMYKVTPAGAVNGTGKQWHGFFRKGSENKVVVYFFGGGVSVDEYTAARGSSVAPVGEVYYFDGNRDSDEMHYMAALKEGLASTADVNPFKDWSLVMLPYYTGDFHCGCGTRPYIGLDGKEHTVYYNGYNNFNLFMEKVLPLLGTPDALLVTGSSGGGFGTAILSDAVAGLFPETKNVTSVVDAAFMRYDKWKQVAEKEWQAPAEIVARINSDDLVLDCLKALHNDKPYVKIMYASSPRDLALTLYQHYFIDGTRPTPNQAAADAYQQSLKQMISDFREAIPEGGVNIWDDGLTDETTTTTHTIESNPNMFVDLNGKGSFAQWVMNAVNGKVEVLGLDILDNTKGNL